MEVAGKLHQLNWARTWQSDGGSAFSSLAGRRPSGTWRPPHQAPRFFCEREIGSALLQSDGGLHRTLQFAGRNPDSIAVCDGLSRDCGTPIAWY